MTRALFTGDRNWQNTYLVDLVISGLESMLNGFPKEELVIIEGEARGLDTIARNVAESRHRVTEVEKYPAPWKRVGKRAGNVRNQQMLDEGKPQLVFAFHNDLPRSSGTLDMIERSLRAGLSTVHISLPTLDRCRNIRAWQADQKRKGLWHG